MRLSNVKHDFRVSWCWCRLTVTRRVSLVEEELLTLPVKLSSLPGLSGVARSLVFCHMFWRFVIRPFSFDHCIVCLSSIDDWRLTFLFYFINCMVALMIWLICAEFNLITNIFPKLPNYHDHFYLFYWLRIHEWWN
jgi:hypothetical protein